VIEWLAPMKRTLLAVAIALLISTLCVPSYGISTYGVPFFNESCDPIWGRFSLQTIFLAVAAAVIVNLSRRALRRVLWTAGILAILLAAWIGFSAFQAEMKARAGSEQGAADSQIKDGNFEAAKEHLLKAADYWWWKGSLGAAREAKRLANDQASMKRQYAQVQREREKKEESKDIDLGQILEKYTLRASSDKFRQVDLGLVEPYGFTLNGYGDGGGWIRNKSSVPIDAVDIHIEIKNFAGDTFTSETHTVMTQIPPGRASKISFTVSSSPRDNGLSSDPVDAYTSYGLDENENPFAKYANKQWTWHMQIRAAGTTQR
jgi:hypothetical protein